jgi:predicted HTH domain antitoxin
MDGRVILEVSQDILNSARITPSEILVELAICLYAQGRLSIGRAHEMAGVSLWEFRLVLVSHRIAVHNDLIFYLKRSLQNQVIGGRCTLSLRSVITTKHRCHDSTSSF